MASTTPSVASLVRSHRRRRPYLRVALAAAAVFGALGCAAKAERVRHYVENMVYEVGVIAHSCGVREPRALQRYHARIVTESGRSLPLDEACAAQTVAFSPAGDGKEPDVPARPININ